MRRNFTTIINPHFIVVCLAIAVYIATMLHLTFLKFYTFHATYLDLGLYNQTFWILSHGGIPSYNANLASYYPLQYEKPLMFLILGIYEIAPSPYTLLTIQTAALGLSALPLFFISQKLTKSNWISLIVSISILVYFPTISANMFDFHMLSLLPILYLFMALFWLIEKRALMILFAVLASMANPLSLLLVIFFLAYVVLEGLMATEGVRRLSKKATLTILLLIFGLGVIFALYKIFGTLYIESGLVGSNLTFVQILFSNINYKLLLVLFLFGALAFLPLFEPITLFLVAPYFGFVLLSTVPQPLALFGLMYTSFAIGPLYLGSVLFISKLVRQTQHEQNEEEPARENYNRGFSLRRVRKCYAKPIARIILGFVIMNIIFSMIFLPVSPVNKYVSGGYFNGNYSGTSITSVTPEVQFLHEVINLIPGNASVITQNNIPQVSSRLHITIIQSASLSAYNYDYILIDTAINYFSDSGIDLSYAMNAYNSGAYGILAEGYGALLLEKGYASKPVLYVPYSANISATQFELFGSSSYSDGTIVNQGPNSSFMWYGPYINLNPGEYRVDYELSMAGPSFGTGTAITIDVYDNPVIFSVVNITTTDLQPYETQKTFELHFNTTSFLQGCEFRGWRDVSYGQVTFYGVNITQVSP